MIMRKKLAYMRYILPLSLMAFIFFMSSRSNIETVPMFPHADKLIHFAAYVLVSAAWVFALKGNSLFNGKKLGVFLLAMVVSSLYGLSDEIHQMYVPGRTCDMFDWLADSVGSVVGAWVWISVKITKQDM